MTYFVTNNGFLYFCGKYFDQKNSEIFVKTPKQLHETYTIQELPQIYSFIYENDHVHHAQR